MKPRVSLLCRMLLTVGPILFGTAVIVSAASAKTNSPIAKGSKSPSPTNAAPAAVENHLSVFTVPATEKDGKDPFFPRSKRPYASAPVPVVTNQVPVVADLKINGTSGSAERPLVIINNVTFGVGDTNDVISGTRRVSVHCLEIDLSAGRATVQVAGQRRILHFQKADK